MDCDLALVNGDVFVNGSLTRTTVAVTDGKISALCSPDQDIDADRTVDADGKLVLPGGVDPHVHMMDPGQTEREDFPTGTAAAGVLIYRGGQIEPSVAPDFV
jgi:dihydroorotase-like cyclic amidohydrolase